MAPSATLSDYLGFQLGRFAGALALTFLASYVIRRLCFQRQRGRTRAIGPSVVAFLVVPTWFGWAQARDGAPAWLSTYLTYGLAAFCMALIDSARYRRIDARAASAADVAPEH